MYGHEGPEFLSVDDMAALLEKMLNEGDFEDGGCEGWVHLGLLWRFTGNNEAAIVAFRRALEIIPDHLIALRHHAELLSR